MNEDKQDIQVHFSAGIIIKEDKIFLLLRSKEEEEGDLWCPINETIEDDESPEQAIIRGCKEETDMDFEIKKFLSIHNYSKTEKNTAVFLGEAKGDINLNPEECADSGWFTYEDAIKLDYAFGYKDLIEKLRSKKLI